MLLRVAGAAVTAAAVAASGCAGGGARTETTSLPPGCEVERIEPIVNGFLAAVGMGDAARLRGFVPSSPNYLVHDGDGANERRVHLTRRPDALRYFARRHRAGERARMISLRVAPGIDANHVLVSSS